MARQTLWLAVILCLCGADRPSVAAAQDQTELARAARGILEAKCFGCHGEGGANEGSFNYVLNHKLLVARRKIEPGNADGSELLQRILPDPDKPLLSASGKSLMPDGGPALPQEEIDTLRKWIEAGAPNFGSAVSREFVSPAAMLAAMSADLEQAAPRDRPFFRYFTLTHLHNAGFDDDQLESHRQGLSKLVNSLSWGRQIRPPVPIDKAKTILRIDLRWYRWNETDTWNEIVAQDPYRVVHADPAAQACYRMTRSELPHVRADWFVFSASRPPLYHTILRLPDDPVAFVNFEKNELGVDVARNLVDFNDVVRAGFFPSGVSKSNRLIERHVSKYGSYWKSYDFKPIVAGENPPRRRNLKANPTGPGGGEGFEHDGGEMIFSLPNGLQGYLLTDARGQRIDKGPTDVVVDRNAVNRGRDPEVVNGVSCMNCHWSGMLDKTDQIRRHVLANPKAYDEGVLAFVEAVYVEKEEFAAKLKEDRERFARAVKECGTPLSKSEPVATLAYQFDEPLDIDLAASEAGVTVAVLQEALRRDRPLARQLGGLLQGQPVPRETYVANFPELVRVVNGGRYMADFAALPRTDHISKSTGMRLALIPAGEFLMGSGGPEALEVETRGYRYGENPQHRVRIATPFHLGRFEVTQAEFQKVMGRQPSHYAPTGRFREAVVGMDTSRFPVEMVTWYDAIDFCNQLSSLDGLPPYYGLSAVERDPNTRAILKGAVTVLGGTGYRLPTEAEWEYACRAGTTTPYHFGSTLNGEQANVSGDQPFGMPEGPNLNRPTSVNDPKYPRNAFGLAHMHGNADEWCEDGYVEGAYALRGEVTVNPVGGPGNGLRVLRGAGWSGSAFAARSAMRFPVEPESQFNSGGLRVARTP